MQQERVPAPHAALLIASGLLGLAAGGEALVRGAARLAAAAGVAPLVIGLTVVAYGTSAPELAVNVRSALDGQADIALGNVVGSNIFNVLVILGTSALIAPLAVAARLIRLEVPLVIVVSGAVYVMGLDGRIGRLDGALLVAGAAAYTAYAAASARRESPFVQEQYAREFGRRARRPWAWTGDLALIAAGLALLVVGARWLVEGGVAVARAVGVSELVVGLTIVAAGTSLPEVAASVVATLRGERDIAVGNVVGSNLCNLLVVLGASATLAPAGVAVAPAAMGFDIPVMIAAAVACLPIFVTGRLIARWEGALCLAYYGAYVAYLVLDAAGHDALPAFSGVMLAFVLPLTAVTLVALAARDRWAATGATGDAHRDPPSGRR
ncbi:MAG: calcium/sodium antiporter [Armatimonadota bacterium]|nr:calcium/sodium antiporter [Armatimonadota bacterium]